MHGLLQHPHVAVLDVAPVLAQVDGDAVGAGQLASAAAVTGSGSERAAGLAQVAT